VQVVLVKTTNQKGDGFELVMAFRGTEVTYHNPFTNEDVKTKKYMFPLLPSAETFSDASVDLKSTVKPVTGISGLEGKAGELAGCMVGEGKRGTWHLFRTYYADVRVCLCLKLT
jgi:hypothetical protein